MNEDDKTPPATSTLAEDPGSREDLKLENYDDAELEEDDIIDGYDFNVADPHGLEDEYQDDDVDDDNSVTAERGLFEAEVLPDLFRFQIGDRVVPRRKLEEYIATAQIARLEKNKKRGAWNIPHPLQVIETMIQTCHGGTQYQVKLSGYQDTAKGGPSSVILCELELVPYSDLLEAIEAQVHWENEQESDQKKFDKSMELYLETMAMSARTHADTARKSSTELGEKIDQLMAALAKKDEG